MKKKINKYISNNKYRWLNARRPATLEDHNILGFSPRAGGGLNGMEIITLPSSRYHRRSCPGLLSGRLEWLRRRRWVHNEHEYGVHRRSYMNGEAHAGSTPPPSES